MSQYFEYSVRLDSSIAANLMEKEMLKIFKTGYFLKSIEKPIFPSELYQRFGWEDMLGDLHRYWLYFDIWGYPITFTIHTYASDFDHIISKWAVTGDYHTIGDVAVAILNRLNSV